MVVLVVYRNRLGWATSIVAPERVCDEDHGEADQRQSQARSEIPQIERHSRRTLAQRLGDLHHIGGP